MSNKIKAVSFRPATALNYQRSNSTTNLPRDQFANEKPIEILKRNPSPSTSFDSELLEVSID